MASIERRPNGRWRARYRLHPGGPQRARHFDRKVDAEPFLTRVQGQLLDGSYIDPSAGQVVVRAYAVAWQAAQIHRPTTVVQDTYAHLWPDNEERTRAAVDDVLGRRRTTGTIGA